MTEGQADFQADGLDKPCKTWYKIFGTLTSSSTPLILLHGGPGVPHNYILAITKLATITSTPVIVYDQIGCGNSTHLRDQPKEFWQPKLFLAELANLITHLGIKDHYILGQSWGGMLGAMYGISQPKGLRKLIIADSPASMVTWVKVANKLREALPEDVQEALTRCEREGTTDSKEYEEAMKVFYDRHVCRVVPNPKDVADSMAKVKEDPTVYETMNGPSEFFVSGSLKRWTIEDDLHKISVPTLLINGKYDEAQDEVVEPFFKAIEKVKWIRFAESSHMPHVEEPEEYLKVVKEFLESE